MRSQPDHRVDPATPEPPCPDCGTDLFVGRAKQAHGWICHGCDRVFHDSDLSVGVRGGLT